MSNLLPSQRLASLFEEHPCWTIEPLAVELNYSIPSVRRFLSQVGYHRSFTHNGRWYTPYWVPRFNRDGLWFSASIGFSRAGNLNNTLIKLIKRSPAGMTAEELGEKLRSRCHSVLVQLCRRGKLQREKSGRSYVYLAADQRIADNQRQAMASLSPTPDQLPAEIAVWALVEFIRNPESSFEELAKILKANRRLAVTAAQIERLFEQYGVKKTP